MNRPTEAVLARRLGGRPGHPTARRTELDLPPDHDTAPQDLAPPNFAPPNFAPPNFAPPNFAPPRLDPVPSHDGPAPSGPDHTPGHRGVATRGVWTAGREHVSTLARLGVWLLILAGPAALVWVATSRPAPALPTAAVVVDPGPERAVMSAAEFAAATWSVAGTTAEVGGPLPAAATVELTPPPDPAAPGPRVWSVLVAVSQAVAAGADPVTAAPTVTYVQVPMIVDVGDGGLPAISALGRPAVVPGPGPATGAVSPYATVLPLSDPRAAAGATFVAALVTGGDVTPLTTPGSALRAVSPPPAAIADVREVAVTADLGDGADEVAVAVTAILTSPPDAAVPDVPGPSRETTYYLSLRERDARWEVAAILPGPAAAPVPTDR